MRWRAAVALAAAGALLLAAYAAADPTRSQRFFREKLLNDAGTSDEITDLLRTGGGFIDRSIAYRDLTGDDRDDAVIRVHSGGAAGVMAIYVFSTHGKKALRVLYRQQRLVRGSTRVAGRRLTYRTAQYKPGDELCCPSAIGETEVRWDPRNRRFRVHEQRVVIPPPPEPE